MTGPPKDDARGSGGRRETQADSLSQQCAAELSPSACGDRKAGRTALQPPRSCVTCGVQFAPVKSRFRKCLACARAFKAAAVELVRQRTQDGVTCAELREVLPGLAATTPAAAEFLRRVAESSQ